jgi:hypothetical protein
MRRQVEHPALSLKHLSGPEIETLADYLGQGALGVLYTDSVRGLPKFHPLKKAYDDVIAESSNGGSQLCLSTDSNRSEEGHHFPMRTCIEFRAGPKLEMTDALLHLVRVYSDWLMEQKRLLRETRFASYKDATRKERLQQHFLKMSDFVAYYNASVKAKETLVMTEPHHIFYPSNAGPDFEFVFPHDAEWVILLEYEDLAPSLVPVFFAQYNLSIPIGCVFDPETKHAFPLQSHFSLLFDEKEIAADFNESRPHAALRAYENDVFMAAVRHGDAFADRHHIPITARGTRDFLRGIAFEIAMISTSQAHLMTLFEDEALWIASQHQKAAQEQGATEQSTAKPPKDKVLREIKESLSNTVKKSLFSYFMKTTLADFFKQLPASEQLCLRQISRANIRIFCQRAIKLANGGRGNAGEHHSRFFQEVYSLSSFMDKFDAFYRQTFLGEDVPEQEYAADPIGCLTTRLIPPVNIGSKAHPVPAVVVEIRQPEQGNQSYAAIKNMCTQYQQQHHEVLERFHVRDDHNKKHTKKRAEELSLQHHVSASSSGVLSRQRSRLTPVCDTFSSEDDHVRKKSRFSGKLSRDEEQIAPVNAARVVPNHANGLFAKTADKPTLRNTHGIERSQVKTSQDGSHTTSNSDQKPPNKSCFLM